MTTTADYIARHNEFIAPSAINKENKILLLHGTGQGIKVNDSWCNTYAIFDSEVAVNALGFRHPKLMEFRAKYPEFFDFCEATGRYYAMLDVQLSWKSYPELSPAILAERLIKKTFPGKSPKDYMVIMKESGALAVNSAVKACIKARPTKKDFISFKGAFHGRVEFARALTYSKPIQQEDYPPSGIGVYRLPFPQNWSDVEIINEELERIPLNNVNAAIVEIIQGEGGMQCANPYLLKNLLKHFQQKDIWVGVDDIQAGSGRTGFWSTWEYLNEMTKDESIHSNFTPNFAILGKALGLGMPIGAVVFPKIHLPNGWEGGTFPWFPASVAQAILFLDIIEDEKLIEKVKENGEYLKNQLITLSGEIGQAKQIVVAREGEEAPKHSLYQKGVGFMQGLEFKEVRKGADHETRDKVLVNLAKNGILTHGAGLNAINPTIRFTPPYITTKEDIDEMITALKKSILEAI